MATRQSLSAVFLFTRLLADGVRIFAGAIPLALITGWDVSWAIVAMGGLTLLYTAFGGMRAVVWTDVLQLGVFIAGGIAVLIVAPQMACGLEQAWTGPEQAGTPKIFEFPMEGPFGLLGGLGGCGVPGGDRCGPYHSHV